MKKSALLAAARKETVSAYDAYLEQQAAKEAAEAEAAASLEAIANARVERKSRFTFGRRAWRFFTRQQKAFAGIFKSEKKTLDVSNWEARVEEQSAVRLRS